MAWSVTELLGPHRADAESNKLAWKERIPIENAGSGEIKKCDNWQDSQSSVKIIQGRHGKPSAIRLQHLWIYTIESPKLFRAPTIKKISTVYVNWAWYKIGVGVDLMQIVDSQSKIQIDDCAIIQVKPQKLIRIESIRRWIQLSIVVLYKKEGIYCIC